MARKSSTDLNLLGYALLNALLNPVSSDPTGLGAGDAGRVWVNTSQTPVRLKYWTGTAAIDVLDRTNHQGTQLAATISDLAATVMAYRLDQFAAPTGPVSFAGQLITNVADPSAAQGAATKNYVDSVVASLTSGQVPKGAVLCASTTNVSLSSPGATIDGVTMAGQPNQIVLLAGQTTPSQNGPYVWTAAGSPLTRATNWDSSAKATLGSFWVVEQGSRADQFAILTNDSTITLGTTAPTFTFIGSGTTYTAGNGIAITAGSIAVNPATNGGIAVAAGGVSVDTTIVGRKVSGLIPASSTGIFSISGSTVTINYALANPAASFTLRAYTTPVSGYVQGDEAWVTALPDSAGNNMVVTLPAAPATNNWTFEIIG